jgi:hypothetical protein
MASACHREPAHNVSAETSLAVDANSSRLAVDANSSRAEQLHHAKLAAENRP